MRIERGDMTVGDVGIPITVDLGEALAGLNIDLVFVKPDGSTFTRDVDSVSGTVATYATVSGDIDMSGIWTVYPLNATTGYHYSNLFRLLPGHIQPG